MRFFFVAATLVGALAWCGMRVVDQRHRAVELGYEIASATATQRDLQDELRQLRIDRAAMLDPKRLEPLAVREGLRVPAPDEVVIRRPEADEPGRRLRPRPEPGRRLRPGGGR